jgi:hypothetical protein
MNRTFGRAGISLHSVQAIALVDLERRTVIDVLPDRSAVSTATWLAERPSIELIARDRDGLYADASRQGASQAKQIAVMHEGRPVARQCLDTPVERDGWESLSAIEQPYLACIEAPQNALTIPSDAQRALMLQEAERRLAAAKLAAFRDTKN